MTDEIIVPLEEFSESGWTNYGANYFLNRLSTNSSGIIDNRFTVRIMYRTLPGNQLNFASNAQFLYLAPAIDGVRVSEQSTVLTFNAGLVFDELYLVVYAFDTVSGALAPSFIKQIDNSFYVSGGNITISNFKLKFIDPNTTEPFEFPEIAPIQPINGGFEGDGGTFEFTLPGGGGSPQSDPYTFEGDGGTFQFTIF